MGRTRGSAAAVAALLTLALTGGAAAAPAEPGRQARPALAAAGLGDDPAQFGDIELGTSSTVTLTYANHSDESIDITDTGITVDGQDAGDFKRIGGDCIGDVTVPSGVTCTVTVRFTPTAPELRTATLTVHLDTLPNATSALIGTGVVTNPIKLPGDTFSVGGDHRTAPSGALARTASSGTKGRLHAVTEADVVGGVPVSDAGPHAAVVYTRSADDGQSWGQTKRLNATKRHGTLPVVAGAGTRVYAAWVEPASWNHATSSTARVVRLRRNTNQGLAGSWRAAQALSPSGGRVDRVAIAAADKAVYLVWTNAKTGDIVLATSHDRGATFRTKTLGRTTHTERGIGRSGGATIAAAGSTVLVSWLSTTTSALVARISTDGGASFASARRFGTATGPAAVSVLGKRAAVAWIAPIAQARVAVWSGSWGAIALVPAVAQDGSPYQRAWYPSVALTATKGVAVAFAACDASAGPCAATVSAADRLDIVYSESRTNGRAFPTADRIADGGSAGAMQADRPTVVRGVGGARFVLLNRGTTGTGDHRVSLWRSTAVGVP